VIGGLAVILGLATQVRHADGDRRPVNIHAHENLVR
jgi:hypothetical protein